MVIRDECERDIDEIAAVLTAAFEAPAEAELVAALRASGSLLLSLVAELEGRVVGHIAFSPVTLSHERAMWSGVGLAPMAVLPELQRRGIGGALIDEGLRRLRAAGQRFCVVVGHPDYYPRHGFERASLHGIRWVHPVPDEAFMVQALQPEGLAGVAGTLRYRPEFDVFE